jgi:hypothetical protein
VLELLRRAQQPRVQKAEPSRERTEGTEA